MRQGATRRHRQQQQQQAAPKAHTRQGPRPDGHGSLADGLVPSIRDRRTDSWAAEIAEQRISDKT